MGTREPKIFGLAELILSNLDGRRHRRASGAQSPVIKLRPDF